MKSPAMLYGLAALLLSSFLTTAVRAAQDTPSGPATDTAPAEHKEEPVPVPEPEIWATKHQIRIGGKTLAYTATAGTLLMKNDKDEPVALFGFTAYVRDDGDPRTRPIVFAYNGGPGSASAWLHMGILGPKRTVLTDVEHNTRGPFRTVDNEFGVLDHADLVMLDPVGTGFSRAVGKGEGKDFWGVDQDIKSVSAFIVQYLGEYGRWASPKFLLGESYGGMRSGGVGYDLLTRHDVALNGMILVSPYLDLGSGWAGIGLDVPYVNFLSTYAATAWYHKAIADRPAELVPFLREVEEFARNEYAPVLLKGARASAAERQSVLEGLARYTGISADYWDKANLRVDEGHFLQELMRNKGVVTGRVDTRYTGPDLNPLAEVMKYDPYAASVASAIVATFNDYYRNDLKVESDRPYVLSAELWKDWDNRHQQPDIDQKLPYPNTAVDLALTLQMNPTMKVLVQQGYFDLACPYGTVEYALDHLNISPGLRGNISIEYYEAGHMMYVHPPSMQKFKRVLAAFIDANAG
jgi:carboxypeptidase C (cathepsin A)